MAISAAAYTLTVVLCICSLQLLVAGAGPETLKLTFYAHETRGGPNATLLPAAGTGQGNFSALGWGSFMVFDNRLKEGAAADSKLLGRITGSGALTTIGGLPTGGVQVTSKFWFGEGSKYPGSSFTLVGTLSYGPAPWELIVIGGTGYFRGFSGYGLSAPENSTTVPPLFVYKWNFHLTKHF
ncbi:dirigent protein 11 [Physcomitrium patens]|uniref:Dirigent protein n=1 Tax=Physcomitrium patens TaxID=3218 RepID=A0A2K1KKR4_PHYPA|nr:dirigent protein 19-like [Physcomitrium patens]PNR54359.1 hypothetical protein PHYPA_008036 [Physcomitrium patens]|eukprot:XP_024375472.1 dirigent protein 19-like [Physcomitrella patens]